MADSSLRQHNASPSRDVVTNPDPALDISHEHHHTHLHHSAAAEKGRHDDIAYSTGTTADKSTIPLASPLDNVHHRQPSDAEKYNGIIESDTEKGRYTPNVENTSDRDPQSHKWSRFYAKHRVYFHLGIWCLFTG